MQVNQIQLRNFRSYEELDLAFGPGLTVITGENGAGKTNLLEAVGYCAVLKSFRGAPTEALVLEGETSATIRAQVEVAGRSLLIESEIVPGGRSRMLLNKLPRRAGASSLVITTFSPDDLVTVKGGPSYRRDFVDELLSATHPKNEALIGELEKILRQRNALLKQANGRLSAEIAFTLDVWDEKLSRTGEAIVRLRLALLENLAPFIQRAHNDVSDRPSVVECRYVASFALDGYLATLQSRRLEDVKRATTSSGPHRDEVDIRLDGSLSRTHASQGEQRTLALALRLGGHRYLSDCLGSVPVLILDDVFSELDPRRADALVRNLPRGQAFLATAGAIPPSAEVRDQVSVTRIGHRSGSIALTRAHVRSVDNTVDSVDQIAHDRVETRVIT